jgi:hypothetical protein
MSDVKFKIIGKIIAVDLDIDGNLHITLKNSTFWAEHAVKHLRALTNQIIETEVKKWSKSKTS